MMDSSIFDTFFNTHKSQEKMGRNERRREQDVDLIPSAPNKSLDSFHLSKSSFDFTMSQVLTPRPSALSGDVHFKPSVFQQTRQPLFDTSRRKPVIDKRGCFGIKPEIVTPAIYSQSGAHNGGETRQLRSIEEIPYRHIFSFQYFNYLQSKVLDEVLYTDNSVVVSAPTGSGKTVVFELALIRLLMKTEHTYSGKIIYMAPMKALCTERFQDWQEKFPNLKCLKVTGDSEIDDLTHLKDVNLICTTPEKWDSMSRRWKDKKGFFHGIRLFLIDEIHVLNDKTRGATVEAVVSRMKTLQTASSLEDSGNAIRFIAVSATLPNYDDIAEWLSTPSKPTASYNIEEKHRPVKIDRCVIGYPFKTGSSDFRFDMNLSYRLKGIIDAHCHGKPTLVFCSSRKSVIQSGEILAKNVRSFVTHNNALILQQAAMTVHEQKVSDLLNAGIGVHHAGLTLEDRQTVEGLFRNSHLPVLISTSTLAMGVNLPAHLVVIKSTHFYNMGAVVEYSDMQLLQMIGRAGRPQFDTSATAVIMTKDVHKSRYESLVNGTQLVESSLHKNLIEHLNAEIVLQTITDMSLAVEWMRQTFLYVRVLKNPKYYGLPVGLSKREVEKRLQDLCLKDLNLLTGLSLVTVEDESYAIIPQETGRLMARYCIAFETMKQFLKLGDHQESVVDMIDVVSACAEFEDIQLRINEKRTLNSLNRDKSKESISLIQAQLSCLPIQDFSLSQDVTKIFRVGQRVAKCLMELLYLQGDNYSLMLHAILVYKGLKTRLWFDSSLISRQLDGIGPTMSLALAKAGLSSFQMLEQAYPRDIELIVNRHPPFGNQIKECVSKLPRYELAVEQVNRHAPDKAMLSVCIDLLNRSRMEDEGGMGGGAGSGSHQAFLLIGDEDNAIVFKWRIVDNKILAEGPWTRTVEVKRAQTGPKLSISLLSLDWVGLDIQTEYEPMYTPGWHSRPKQVPASKLRDTMDRAKQKKNVATTPASKSSVKRTQTSKDQSNNKKAKMESKHVSVQKADILSTILGDMEKTFPMSKSRITLNKFAYEKPPSLSHKNKESLNSNETIQHANPNGKMNSLKNTRSDELMNLDLSFAPESKTCSVNIYENDGEWNDDDALWGINMDMLETLPLDVDNQVLFQSRSLDLNEERNVLKQKYATRNEPEKYVATHNAQSDKQQSSCVAQSKISRNSCQLQNGFGIAFPSPSMKQSETMVMESSPATTKSVVISTPNPRMSLFHPMTSHQQPSLSPSHQSNIAAAAASATPNPPRLPSTRGPLSPRKVLPSATTNRPHHPSHWSVPPPPPSTILPASLSLRGLAVMGWDVDDFMRQQGYFDTDNSGAPLSCEDKKDFVEESKFPATSNSDEDLYYMTEEHETSHSVLTTDHQNSVAFNGQDRSMRSVHHALSDSSSPLPSPHHTVSATPTILTSPTAPALAVVTKPMAQTHHSSERLFYNVQDDDAGAWEDEISWSPLTSQLSQQIPLTSHLSQQIPLPPSNATPPAKQGIENKLGVWQMQGGDRHDVKVSKMKAIGAQTKTSSTTGSVGSPRRFGLVQAWPRTGKTQRRAKTAMEFLPDKRTGPEISSPCNEPTLVKSSESPQYPQIPSMFVPECEMTAADPYIPGKLFDGIFDNVL